MAARSLPCSWTKSNGPLSNPLFSFLSPELPWGATLTWEYFVQSSSRISTKTLTVALQWTAILIHLTSRTFWVQHNNIPLSTVPLIKFTNSLERLVVLSSLQLCLQRWQTSLPDNTPVLNILVPHRLCIYLQFVIKISAAAAWHFISHKQSILFFHFFQILVVNWIFHSLPSLSC